MKTHTITREDGKLQALEVDNTWLSILEIKTVLRSVPGVTSLKWNFRSEDRFEFTYNGEEWIVWEPLQHCSRYWIGPKDEDNHSYDVTSINNAFIEHQPLHKRVINFIAEKSRHH